MTIYCIFYSSIFLPKYLFDIQKHLFDMKKHFWKLVASGNLILSCDYWHNKWCYHTSICRFPFVWDWQVFVWYSQVFVWYKKKSISCSWWLVAIWAVTTGRLPLWFHLGRPAPINTTSHPPSRPSSSTESTTSAQPTPSSPSSSASWSSSKMLQILQKFQVKSYILELC